VEIGPWQLILVLLIVLLLFGTKKLRNIGSDLGSAVRDFKKGMGGDDKDDDAAKASGEKLKADAPEPEAHREQEKTSQDSKGR